MERNKLYILCGIPASGKSTWAKSEAEKDKNVHVVSRDEIRFSLLKPGENYFSKENETWKRFVKEIRQSLMTNKITIADATHLNKYSRKKLLGALRIPRMCIEITAVSFDIPFEIAFKRNSRRTGRALVPENSLREMYENFVPPTFAEGFDKILSIRQN